MLIIPTQRRPPAVRYCYWFCTHYKKCSGEKKAACDCETYAEVHAYIRLKGNMVWDGWKLKMCDDDGSQIMTGKSGKWMSWGQSGNRPVLIEKMRGWW